MEVSNLPKKENVEHVIDTVLEYQYRSYEIGGVGAEGKEESEMVGGWVKWIGVKEGLEMEFDENTLYVRLQMITTVQRTRGWGRSWAAREEKRREEKKKGLRSRVLLWFSSFLDYSFLNFINFWKVDPIFSPP